MAYKKLRNDGYIADTKEDLALIPENDMGSECFVINEACEYKLMSTGEWVKQIVAPAAADIDTSIFATKEEVADAVKGISFEGLAAEKDVADLMAMVKACYRPVKYNISNTPKGTMVDYREKEIRIFCPEGTVFTKQNVGEGGSENIYYMTFTSYAPEGAVTFKEGDRGVLVDELLDFKNTAGTGVDKFGRKYKNHWFALASYNATTDSWTYYGANSNVAKYIGWTYIVEWYDADGNVIDTDKIRINLSNKDCHLTLEPYYG